MRLFIDEAAKSGMIVEGHVQTPDGARRAIDAGIWSIAHSEALDDETHKQMAAKLIPNLAFWPTPEMAPKLPLPKTYRGSQDESSTRRRDRPNPRRARRTPTRTQAVPLTFSTDADYYVPGRR